MKAKFSDLMQSNNIQWSKHTLQRMLERGITRDEVKESLLNGEIIETYMDDKPFPSYLVHYKKKQYLHIVVSLDESSQILYIITAYIPDLKHFENDYKTRIKK